jgi:enoyl-CoA hydratase/carnithine racemase
VLQARFDPGVHVIVITGAAAGGKTEFFCAGADIKMLEGADAYFKYDGALDSPGRLLPELISFPRSAKLAEGCIRCAKACEL